MQATQVEALLMKTITESLPSYENILLNHTHPKMWKNKKIKK